METLTLDGIDPRPEMPWQHRGRSDRDGAALADRHYSRKTPGTPQWMPSGRALVFVTPCGRATWGTSYSVHPDDGLDSWRCTIFRNEGAGLSSDLILHAMALTAELWGEPPADGWLTYVKPDEVRSTNPGFCFLKAGWWRDHSYVPDRRRGNLIRLRA